jgi:hypothetical protein
MMKPIAIAAVFASIVAGLVLLGPPSEARARKLDEQRVRDLQQVAGAVDLHRTRQGGLPATLGEASREMGQPPVSGDPVTGEPYPYRVVGADTYELCADFQRASEAQARAGAAAEFWSHRAGHQCFELKPRTLPR